MKLLPGDMEWGDAPRGIGRVYRGHTLSVRYERGLWTWSMDGATGTQVRSQERAKRCAEDAAYEGRMPVGQGRYQRKGLPRAS